MFLSKLIHLALYKAQAPHCSLPSSFPSAAYPRKWRLFSQSCHSYALQSQGNLGGKNYNLEFLGQRGGDSQHIQVILISIWVDEGFSSTSRIFGVSVIIFTKQSPLLSLAAGLFINPLPLLPLVTNLHSMNFIWKGTLSLSPTRENWLLRNGMITLAAHVNVPKMVSNSAPLRLLFFVFSLELG